MDSAHKILNLKNSSTETNQLQKPTYSQEWEWIPTTKQYILQDDHLYVYPAKIQNNRRPHIPHLHEQSHLQTPSLRTIATPKNLTTQRHAQATQETCRLPVQGMKFHYHSTNPKQTLQIQ